MRFGVFASLLFHLALVGAAFISLPEGWRPDVTPEPYIPLELIAEAELDLTTSVPAALPEPEAIEEEPEPDLPEPVEEIEPEPTPIEEEPEPVVEEPEPEPEPAPIEEQPEPETPAVRPEPKNNDLDLDALSKLIDKEREDEQTQAVETPSETVEQADQARAAVGAGDRLTASDRAKMKAAVERCWNAGTIIGMPNAEDLIVEVRIELNRDGTLVGQPQVVNSLQINLSGNRFWKVAEKEALRAAITCAPYDIFPQDRYQDWKSFILNFDPGEMVGR